MLNNCKSNRYLKIYSIYECYENVMKIIKTLSYE
jgi:hypothetical protein